MHSSDDPFATRASPTDPLNPAPTDPLATRDPAGMVANNVQPPPVATDDPHATREQAGTDPHRPSGPHDTTYDAAPGHAPKPASVQGHEILKELGRDGTDLGFQLWDVASRNLPMTGGAEPDKK